MRFFHGRRFSEIGAKFDLTEDAVRMRVERALEKLRAALARREITSTSAALGLILANNAGAAAAADIASSIAAAAVANAGATVAGAASGIGFMATATKSSILLCIAVVGVFTTIAYLELGATRATEAALTASNQAVETLAAQLAGAQRRVFTSAPIATG